MYSRAGIGDRDRRERHQLALDLEAFDVRVEHGKWNWIVRGRVVPGLNVTLVAKKNLATNGNLIRSRTDRPAKYKTTYDQNGYYTRHNTHPALFYPGAPCHPERSEA